MNINSVSFVNFSSNNKKEKVYQPRTYFVYDTTVTLNSEEEKVHQEAVQGFHKALGYGALVCGALFGGVAKKFHANALETLVCSAVGAVAGGVIGTLGYFSTKKSAGYYLPQQKIMLENGVIRQNLANKSYDNK